MHLGYGKCTTAKQAGALAAFIESNTKIEKWNRVICLNCNYMGDANGVALARALKTSKTVEAIYLQGNGFSDAGGAAFAAAIKANRTLKVISLGGNRFAGACVGAFADALKCNTSLEHLDLRFNDSWHWMLERAAAIKAAARSGCTVVH